MLDKAFEAFKALKTALCNETVISYPRSDRTFFLIFDAATGTDEEMLCQTDEKGDPRVI
jgi:hypothetical protein